MVQLPASPSLADAVTDFGARQLGEFLLAALGVYLLLVATGRLLKYRFGTRLGIVYHFFCIVAGPYLATLLLRLRDAPGRTELGAITAILGTGVAARLLDQHFWRGYLEQKRKAPVPKFIREVAAGLLLTAVAVLVLQFGYGVKVPGLLAASGIVGIILGFAMQDSLGNIIAGFAIQVGRPFQVGDWLLVDGQHVRAVEINWRSTRFVTNDAVQLDVPNQQLVRQTITNFHGGGAVHAFRVDISVEYEVPPNQVKDLLRRAAGSAPGVLPEPAPFVGVKSFADSAIVYEVRVWISDHKSYNVVADAVRTNVWYAMRRDGVHSPYPIRHLRLERVQNQGAHVDRHQAQRRAVLDLLRGQPVFSTLAEIHLQMLVNYCPAQHYGQGETIIHEGFKGSSMFVLLKGEAAVTIRPDETPTWIATLRGGDCFGEMSLLTGEKRSASVVANTDCEVMEITKTVFAEIVSQDPTLLTRLSELLAHRQLETEGIVAAHAQRSANVEQRVQEYQAGFLTRLKSFFEL